MKIFPSIWLKDYTCLRKSNPGSVTPVDVISAEKLMRRRGADDLELLKAAGSDGVIITKDKDFKQIKLYAPIIEATGAKVLFYKNSKKLIYFWDILTATVERWEEIKERLLYGAVYYMSNYNHKTHTNNK